MIANQIRNCPRTAGKLVAKDVLKFLGKWNSFNVPLITTVYYLPIIKNRLVNIDNLPH